MLVCLIILSSVVAALLTRQALLKYDACATGIIAFLADDIIVCSRIENIATYCSTGRIVCNENCSSWTEQAQACCYQCQTMHR